MRNQMMKWSLAPWVRREGRASAYKPMGQKPEKPEERATKSRRQSLESFSEPKSLSTLSFHRWLAAVAWQEGSY